MRKCADSLPGPAILRLCCANPGMPLSVDPRSLCLPFEEPCLEVVSTIVALLSADMLRIEGGRRIYDRETSPAGSWPEGTAKAESASTMASSCAKAKVSPKAAS